MISFAFSKSDGKPVVVAFDLKFADFWVIDLNLAVGVDAVVVVIVEPDYAISKNDVSEACFPAGREGIADCFPT